MACSEAVWDEDDGWKCAITDGACEYSIPNQKRCAEEWGEGPEANE